MKHLVPGGPASLNSQLAVGDVMVSVNGTNVLGYTHSQLVSLFQSIPVGASINLLVSQGYRLRREIGSDPPTHFNGSVSGNHLGATGFVSGVIDISAQVNKWVMNVYHVLFVFRSPFYFIQHSAL